MVNQRRNKNMDLKGNTVKKLQVGARGSLSNGFGFERFKCKYPTPKGLYVYRKRSQLAIRPHWSRNQNRKFVL